MTGVAREGNRVADVLRGRDVAHQPLESEAIAGVRHRPELAQVQVPRRKTFKHEIKEIARPITLLSSSPCFHKMILSNQKHHAPPFIFVNVTIEKIKKRTTSSLPGPDPAQPFSRGARPSALLARFRPQAHQRQAPKGPSPPPGQHMGMVERKASKQLGRAIKAMSSRRDEMSRMHFFASLHTCIYNVVICYLLDKTHRFSVVIVAHVKRFDAFRVIVYERALLSEVFGEPLLVLRAQVGAELHLM